MLVVLRFTTDATPEWFADTLAALAACPGYIRGQLGRALDDPSQWSLVTEWASVGAYRRALGSYDVKLRATEVLGQALPEPSAFEVLGTAEPGGTTTIHGSDRAESGPLPPPHAARSLG